MPHLFVPGPWVSNTIRLGSDHLHHLNRVLRLEDGAAVSYTDGAGQIGEGVLAGDSLRRGRERVVERPHPEIALAVAAPKSAARQRFIVEKLAELGVDRLYWLNTRYRQGRPPKKSKARAWAHAALEQSRGAWLLAVEGPVAIDDLPDWPALFVAERETFQPPSVVNGGILIVGPEAGLAEGEVPESAQRLSLGARVLRVETAAVVGAAVLLERSGRFSH
jgi:16S rRNA (uracil1498-N3)-methyltransferase